MTGCPGVFAGGDMVPSERTVTVGVGHGKKAARHIDAWLRGAAPEPPPKHAAGDVRHAATSGTSATPRAAQQPELEPAERVAGFAEVVGGLSAERGDLRGAAGACPAATASSATAASAPARRTR